MQFQKIVIGISGGVDSAVAALILRNKGFNVHAAFMKNWDEINEKGQCSGERDWDDAQWVCQRLNIPITQINFVKEYWNNVFGNFLKDYEIGLTPNPDILCNRHIKFDYFFKYATETLKADAIATGHYAQTSFGTFLEKFQENKNTSLITATDEFKDQTFFLSQIPQIALQRTMFPVGNLNKHQVKEIAKQSGLDRVAGKKESIGICFIGQRRFKDFISEYLHSTSGEFIDEDTGKVIGNHNGIHHWTVGQRCKISGCLKPYFVLRKETKTNQIFVVGGTDHPSLFTNIVYTDRPYWINRNPFESFIFKCKFRFQHTKPLVNCYVFQSNNLSGNMFVKLEKPLRAITPGQYAVFYKNDECIGNARITISGPSIF